MAANPESNPLGEKPANSIKHVESHLEDEIKPSESVVDAVARGQATSGYETMTLWETVKTFKVASIACFAAAFSAATDGYQIG
jgi:hypothetical protein